MSFAQAGNGSNPFTTEKDLLRQVASNLTKEALVSTKTKIIGGDEDSSTA